MKQAKYYFGAVDYVIFAAMLTLSAAIGVYFAFRHKIFKRQRETLQDYLTGYRNLKPFPVSMSLIASYISGVTMLGTPAEIYTYGAQYWLIVIAMILSGVTVATVYLPVFTKLQVCSSYEYLELRFDKKLRTVASLYFLFDEITFLPMLIYVPSLAFSQVSGVNLHLISIIVCSICVFYTVLGGLRAVVYTDLWQTMAMFLANLVVIIVGVIAIGGFGVIIDRSVEGGRIQNLNFSPSMYERYTVFSIFVGGYFYWTSFNSVNQTMVQRYLSLPNDRQAKLTVGLFTFGVVFFVSLCCFAGLLMYGTYHDCDPLTADRVDKNDQLLPLFVVEVAGHLTGIPGLFIAGVFGAALSSLSVVFNSSSIVLLEDILKGVCQLNLSETKAKIISKTIVILLGVIACALVFVVEQMRGVFEVATSLTSIAAGTMCGVFSLGMLVPWCNVKGAIAGAIAGFSVACTIAMGNQYYAANELVSSPVLPVSVEACERDYNINITEVPTRVHPDDSGVFPLFRLSFMWITPIAVVTVLTVGIITSFITGKNDLKTIDPELISPVFQWMLPPEAQMYAGSAVKRIQHQRLLGGFEATRTASSTADGFHEMRNTETSESSRS